MTGLPCTEACAAMPECTVCGRRKQPRWRDSMDTGLCDSDCPGYRLPPLPGHLWPSEWRDRDQGGGS